MNDGEDTKTLADGASLRGSSNNVPLATDGQRGPDYGGVFSSLFAIARTMKILNLPWSRRL